MPEIAPPYRSAQLELAATLFDRGQTDEAEAFYHTILARWPDLWRAQAGLGQCARHRRNLAEAARHFAQAIATAPAPAPPWLRQGHAGVLREQGQLDEAETAFNALLVDDPQNGHALMGLAQCARQRDDRAAARAYFAAAVSAAPDITSAWIELAREHRDAGEFDVARALLRQRLDMGPGAHHAWLGLGMIERAAGDRSAALQVFKDAYRRHPERHQFAIEIATEEAALGNFARSDHWLELATQFDAVAGIALARLGGRLRAEQQREKALTLLQRAAERRDAPISTHFSLAQCLAELGRPGEALDVLGAAELQYGGRPAFAFKRAAIQRRAGFPREATEIARQAGQAPSDSVAHWREWFENERFCNDPAAIERCMEAAPVGSVLGRHSFQNAKGRLAEQSWQLEEAEAAFRTAIDIDSTASASHELLARVSLLQYDTETASRHLSIVTQLRSARLSTPGSSDDPSSSLLDQIADEFMFDKAAIAGIKNALAAAPDERIARLITLVRAKPDHAPTAIALLVALRRGDWLSLPRHAAGTHAIPRKIIQYWDNPKTPEDVAGMMRSWSACNPDWRHITFDHDGAQSYLTQYCEPAVLGAYLRANTPAKQADVFKLAYLFTEGGCYADADDRCLASLDEFFPPHADFVAWQGLFGSLGNNFMAASPRNRVIGRALELTVQAIAQGDDDLFRFSNGPALFTKAFAQTLAESPNSLATWLDGAVIYDGVGIRRAVAMRCRAAYKASDRHRGRLAVAKRKDVPV